MSTLFARRTAHDLPAFAGWTRREVERFRRLAEHVEYEPGECLTYEGSSAREFIVLLDGEADVRKGGVRVCAFAPGDVAGHQVILGGGTARTTVRARSLCSAWVLTPAAFALLHAEQASFRATLSGAAGHRVVGAVPLPLALVPSAAS